MYRDQRGVISLIVIVMVAAVTLVFGLAVVLMNVDEILASYSRIDAVKAGGQAASCADNALARLLNNSALSGNVNIAAIANVNCIATISGSGNTRTIIANATSTDAFSQGMAWRANINVNINTNPFTIEQYKDILE